ncbi:unnamed protein product, partial [Bubo scandiacus]
MTCSRSLCEAGAAPASPSPAPSPAEATMRRGQPSPTGLPSLRAKPLRQAPRTSVALQRTPPVAPAQQPRGRQALSFHLPLSAPVGSGDVGRAKERFFEPLTMAPQPQKRKRADGSSSSSGRSVEPMEVDLPQQGHEPMEVDPPRAEEEPMEVDAPQEEEEPMEVDPPQEEEEPMQVDPPREEEEPME